VVTRDLAVALERGRSRVFVVAIDWPGWARSVSARVGDEGAIDALMSYHQRYAEVAARAGAAFPSSAVVPRVVEAVVGTATTDFGAPDVVLDVDHPVLTAAGRRDLARQIALLEAAWALLDEIVDGAPEELAKGPRGGGRDTSEVVGHVIEAERAYARKVGVRHPPFAARDLAARAAMRADLVAALRTDAVRVSWPARYALRRTAWHVLDHAWEIQDKSG
jgi:hypothetical protein